MATTRIIPMHINKGKTIAQCMTARLDYVKNPDKTAGGELISSYACVPQTADQEFLLSRNAYLANTGRHIRNEIIAYQLRQSFKPGEVTPEEANQIGYELASQYLKGEHAFIVATHTDRHHIHNHIVFCAVSLDCTHKFKDVSHSWKDLSRLSDAICREHQLSVVPEGQAKTVTYDQWLGENKPLSCRDTLRIMLDTALRMQPDGFDALMQLMEDAGCRIKRGAHISIKPPNGQRYIRLDSLGPEYSEATLMRTLAGKHVHVPKVPKGKYSRSQIELYINIEAKLRDGRGKGYERWAQRHNTDAIAQSMIYLKENHFDSYEMLEDAIQELTGKRNELKARMRASQARMKEISEQKKAILTYRRTKSVYAQYRESGWAPVFYNAHAKEIEAHKAAEQVYQKANGQLPTLAELSAEYDLLLHQKNDDSAALAPVQSRLTDLRRIKRNIDIITDDKLPDAETQKRIDHTVR